MAELTEEVRYDEVTDAKPYIPTGGVYVGPSGTVTVITHTYKNVSALDMHMNMYVGPQEPGVKIPATEITGATASDPAGLIVRGLTPGSFVRYVVTKLTAEVAKVTVSMISEG